MNYIFSKFKIYMLFVFIIFIYLYVSLCKCEISSLTLFFASVYVKIFINIIILFNCISLMPYYSFSRI